MIQKILFFSPLKGGINQQRQNKVAQVSIQGPFLFLLEKRLERFFRDICCSVSFRWQPSQSWWYLGHVWWRWVNVASPTDSPQVNHRISSCSWRMLADTMASFTSWIKNKRIPHTHTHTFAVSVFRLAPKTILKCVKIDEYKQNKQLFNYFSTTCKAK